MTPPHLTIELPEYRLDRDLDYEILGQTVDGAIAEALPDGEYVVRAISSDDHPGKSRGELATLILESGTDKYDPSRLEVAHADFRAYDHDFHGGRFRVTNHRLEPDHGQVLSTMFGDVAYHFREYAPLDRGYPVRVDLLLIYRTTHLAPASRVDEEGPEQRESLTRNLFKFRSPERKLDALAAVVSLLS